MNVTLYGLDTLGSIVETVANIEAETHTKCTLNDVLFIDYTWEQEGESKEYASGFTIKDNIGRGKFALQLAPIDFPTSETMFNQVYKNLPELFKGKKYIYIQSDYKIKYLGNMASCLRVNIDDVTITSRNGMKFVTIQLSEVKSKFAR